MESNKATPTNKAKTFTLRVKVSVWTWKRRYMQLMAKTVFIDFKRSKGSLRELRYKVPWAHVLYMSLIWSFDVDREWPKKKYQYENTRAVCSLNMMISGVLASPSHWRVIIFLGLSQQSSKFPNSSFGRGVFSSRLEIKGAMNADGDSRLKRGLFVFYPWHLGYIVPLVMLSASYTLSLKDQRIFISNTEFTWKT